MHNSVENPIKNAAVKQTLIAELLITLSWQNGNMIFHNCHRQWWSKLNAFQCDGFLFSNRNLVHSPNKCDVPKFNGRLNKRCNYFLRMNFAEGISRHFAPQTILIMNSKWLRHSNVIPQFFFYRCFFVSTWNFNRLWCSMHIADMPVH